MEDKIVVMDFHQTQLLDGKSCLICHMSDGTTWRCDLDGNNWVECVQQPTLPNAYELTELFNNK